MAGHDSSTLKQKIRKSTGLKYSNPSTRQAVNNIHCTLKTLPASECSYQNQTVIATNGQKFRTSGGTNTVDLG